MFYVAFFEIVAICWIYGSFIYYRLKLIQKYKLREHFCLFCSKGAKRLAKNVFLMTGRKPNKYFLACWYFVTPTFILTIWAFNWYQYEPVTYGSYVYPAWAQIMGWLIGLCSIVSIPLGAVHTLAKSPGQTFLEVIYIT